MNRARLRFRGFSGRLLRTTFTQGLLEEEDAGSGGDDGTGGNPGTDIQDESGLFVLDENGLFIQQDP